MAREKVVKLKVESNVENITKEYKGLNQQVKKQDDLVDDTNKSYQKLDKSTSKYTKKTSKNYKKINEEGSKLKSNVDGAGKSFTAGTEAIGFYGDAMSLVGVNSEKLQENLQLVDQAMQLGKGLKGVKEGVSGMKDFAKSSKIAGVVQTAFASIMGVSSGALKIFKLALISTGIGALVVGVGLLVANFDKLLGVFKPIIDGLKKFSDFLGITSYQQEEAEEMRQEQAEASKKRHKAFMKQIEAEKKALDKKLDAEKDIADFKIQQFEMQKRGAKSTKELVALETAQSKQKLKLQDDEYNNFIEKQKLTIQEQEKTAKYLDGVVQRNIARGRKDHTGEVAKAKRLRESNKKLQQQIENDNFLFRQKIQQQRELIERETQDNIAKIRENSNDKYKAYKERRLDAQRELLDRQLNAEMIALETEKVMLEAQGKDLEEINQQIFDKELEEAQINFQREYDDVLKNENLTRKEKNAIREAMEKEWQLTEKQMRSDRDAEEIAEAKEKADRIAEEEKERQENVASLKLEYYATLEEIDNEYFDSQKTAQALEIQAVRDKYYTIEQEAILNGDSIVNIVKLREEQIAEIENKYREDKKQADLKAINEGFAQAKQGSDAIQNLGDLVFSNKMKGLEKGSKEEEALAKKQFEFNKKMQLSGAVIDAGKAIIASLASAPLAIGIVPNPVGIANLALTGITSAINIAKIASTKFSDTQKSPDTPSSSAGGGGGVVSPEFNIVGGAELNDTEGLGQQPLQAYVVSGDVTSAQSLDRNRIENATI